MCAWCGVTAQEVLLGWCRAALSFESSEPWLTAATELASWCVELYYDLQRHDPTHDVLSAEQLEKLYVRRLRYLFSLCLELAVVLPIPPIADPAWLTSRAMSALLQPGGGDGGITAGRQGCPGAGNARQWGGAPTLK